METRFISIIIMIILPVLGSYNNDDHSYPHYSSHVSTKEYKEVIIDEQSEQEEPLDLSIMKIPSLCPRVSNLYDDALSMQGQHVAVKHDPNSLNRNKLLHKRIIENLEDITYARKVQKEPDSLDNLIGTQLTIEALQKHSKKLKLEALASKLATNIYELKRLRKQKVGKVNSIIYKKQKITKKLQAQLIPNTYSYNLGNGLLKAFSVHITKKANEINIRYDLSTYDCNDDKKYFDFQAFYDSHCYLVSPNNIWQDDSVGCHQGHSSNTKTYSASETKLFLDTILKLDYTTPEQKLIELLAKSQYNSNIRFKSLTKDKTKIKIPFLGLNEEFALVHVPIDLFNHIQNTYNTYLRKSLFNDEFIYNRDLFVDYITDMFLHMDTIHKFYAFKPELWKLQLFMPEIYLYIIWQIKDLKKREHGSNLLTYHIFYEANLIFNLLHTFIKLCNTDVEHPETIISVKGMVEIYRKYILSHLNIFHQRTGVLLLYKYGSNKRGTISPHLNNESLSTIFYLLAFTGRSTFLRYIVAKKSYQNQHSKELMRSRFLHSKMMKSKYLKDEVIKTLQFIAIYFSIIKNRQNKISLDQPIVKALYISTLLIYQSDSDNAIYMFSISRLQTLSYFLEGIYEVLKN